MPDFRMTVSLSKDSEQITINCSTGGDDSVPINADINVDSDSEAGSSDGDDGGDGGDGPGSDGRGDEGAANTPGEEPSSIHEQDANIREEQAINIWGEDATIICEEGAADIDGDGAASKQDSHSEDGVLMTCNDTAQLLLDIARLSGTCLIDRTPSPPHTTTNAQTPAQSKTNVLQNTLSTVRTTCYYGPDPVAPQSAVDQGKIIPHALPTTLTLTKQCLIAMPPLL